MFTNGFSAFYSFHIRISPEIERNLDCGIFKLRTPTHYTTLLRTSWFYVITHNSKHLGLFKSEKFLKSFHKKKLENHFEHSFDPEITMEIYIERPMIFRYAFALRISCFIILSLRLLLDIVTRANRVTISCFF